MDILWPICHPWNQWHLHCWARTLILHRCIHHEQLVCAEICLLYTFQPRYICPPSISALLYNALHLILAHSYMPGFQWYIYFGPSYTPNTTHPGPFKYIGISTLYMAGSLVSMGQHFYVGPLGPTCVWAQLGWPILFRQISTLGGHVTREFFDWIMCIVAIRELLQQSIKFMIPHCRDWYLCSLIEAIYTTCLKV